MTLQLRADVSTTRDERACRYWQLNPTGAFVLCALLDGATAQEAAETLADQYTVSAEKQPPTSPPSCSTCAPLGW